MSNGLNNIDSDDYHNKNERELVIEVKNLKKKLKDANDVIKNLLQTKENLTECDVDERRLLLLKATNFQQKRQIQILQVFF